MDLPTEERRRQLIMVTAYIFQAAGLATQIYASPNYFRQEYHTSSLTGAEWVDELLFGHYNRIWTELGLRAHVFLALVEELQVIGGIRPSQNGVGVNEQVAIFLYMCVTGLSVRHVGERFQRSNETISRYVFTIIQCCD